MAVAGRTLVEVSDDDLCALLREENRASLADTLGGLLHVVILSVLGKHRARRARRRGTHSGDDGDLTSEETFGL